MVTKRDDRNRILRKVEFMIPYVKELRRLPLVKSINACILMQQLDYWFNICGKESFYKFLEPPKTEQFKYRVGDSWTEELGMSADEFRTAFNQIGTSYKSKRLFVAEADKFKGKYYCCYTDRVHRETRFFQNHELIERDLDELFSRNQRSKDVDVDSPEFPEVESAGFLQDGSSGLVEDRSSGLESTEITTDTTTEITTDTTTEITSNNNIEREQSIPLSPNVQEEKEEEEIIDKKDFCDSSSSSNDEGEVIEGIPVINESYPRTGTGRATWQLPDDFSLTDQMREWVEGEQEKGIVNRNIDVEHATRKFVISNEGKSHSNWLARWKLWMMNERPEPKTGGYMNASQRQAQQFRELAREDPYADLEGEDNSFFNVFMRDREKEEELYRKHPELDPYRDLTD